LRQDLAAVRGGAATRAPTRPGRSTSTSSSRATPARPGRTRSSPGSGDVRITWVETSAGGNVDAWNAWSRSSTNGGASWTAAVRISDATSGAPYKTAAGYAEVNGDYGEIVIISAGKTIATWGEGASYTGPGGVWVNRSP
jgi:hypothetical protein